MTTQFFRLLLPSFVVLLLGSGLVVANLTQAQATTPILSSADDLRSAADSISRFTLDLNATLDLLISFNDSLNLDQYAPNHGRTQVGGYLNENSPMYSLLTSDHSTRFASLQSISMLSLGLYDESAIKFSVYSEALERIHRGQMIRSLPLSVPVQGTVTSGFGLRNHPILRGRRMHKGLDIAAKRGTPIYTTGGGTVTFSGRKRGYGHVVIVDHGFGYSTLYAHCSKRLVDEGAKVSRGDIIALVGSTGRSTGPHLHYEVMINEVNLNPEIFLVYAREQIESLETIATHYLTF